jgi:hypothetical protein
LCPPLSITRSADVSSALGVLLPVVEPASQPSSCVGSPKVENTSVWLERGVHVTLPA